MDTVWKLLDDWWIITVASTAVVTVQVFALYSALHSLRHVRSSQAAVAWTVGLITLPFLALPLYWVFARHRFEGYREAIRDVGVRHQRSVTAVQNELRTGSYVRSTNQQSALDQVADVLDTPIGHGDEFELLIDGSEFYDALLSAIEKAEQYIYAEFYIIRDDAIGNRFADALIERASAGVTVRILYDEVGCLRLSNAYVARLTAAGIDVRAFNTRQGWVNRFQINFRNHRKLVVVDATTALVGGLNIGDEYIGEAAGLDRWRDTGVLIRGPVTRKVQAVFAGDYYWAARQDLPEASWESEESHPQSAREEQRPGEETRSGNAAVCATGPADVRPRATMMFSAAARAAMNRLWICTPYLVPDESSMVALHMAKSRGVDVRVLIPTESDHWGVYLAGFHFEQELAEADIPVYRYKAGFMHQKCVLVDDALALVGSTNLDNRSLYLNFELMIAIDQPPFVARVAEMLERDFAVAEHSNSPEANTRWWFERAGTAVARLFSPVL
jgi:cardiolipin synthase